LFRMTFSKALLLSFLWHIFCFFAVIIVISPVTTRAERFSKINFIGAILDKDSFSYYKQKGNFAHYYKRDIIGKLKREEGIVIPSSEQRLKYAKRLGAYINKPYSGSITEVIKEKKELPQRPPLLMEELGLMYSSKIKSEVANRQILFKPSVPIVHRTFQAGKVPSKGESFEIKLRFLVSPKGKVVFIEKMKSCGYSDIDLIAIRYIKKWQFAPLGPDKPSKNQEGIMVLKLEVQ